MPAAAQSALPQRTRRATTAIPFVLLSSMAADLTLLSGFKRLPNCKATLVKTHSASEIVGVVKKLLGWNPDK